MGDHNQKNGEFWSAAEEFCSCHRNEEKEEGDENGFWTCSDGADDDDDEYYSVCSPQHPNKDNELVIGGNMKNAETQYDFELSGSGDERPRVQHISENDASNREPEYFQSTRTHAINDSIDSQRSKYLQETSNENKKSTSSESMIRSSSLENRTGVRSGGVSTKRVGLVLGNRKLTSIVGPSILEYDDHSELPNQQDGKRTFQTKSDGRKSGQGAQKTLLRGDDDRRCQPLESTSLNAQGSDDGSDKETESLMILVLQTLPDERESIEEAGTKVATKKSSSTQRQDYAAQEAKRDGDQQTNQTVKKTSQNSPDKSEEKETKSLSHHSQGRTPNAFTQRKDEIIKSEDHICISCSKHLYEPPFDQSVGKTTLEEELPQIDLLTDNLKNGDTKMNRFLKPENQGFQEELEDSEKFSEQFKRNSKNDEKTTSMQSSVPVLSHSMADTEMADVGSTNTMDSVSLQVSEIDKERHVDTDVKKTPRDNGEDNFFHDLKYAQRTCERSNGRRFQGDEVQDDDLQSNYFTNDENRNQRLMKGTDQNFGVKLDDETLMPSHKKQRQIADVQEMFESFDGKQDVHILVNQNESCDQSGSKSFLREAVPLNGLSVKKMRNDAKRRKFLNQARKNFNRKLDNSEKSCNASIQINHESYDQIPSIQSKIPEVSCPSDRAEEADTVATITSKDSIPTIHEAQKADVEKRETLLYNPNQNSAHQWKDPHEESCYERSAGKSIFTKEARKDSLQTKRSKNGNQNGSQSFAEMNYYSKRKDRTVDVVPSIRSSFQGPSCSLSSTDKTESDASLVARDSTTIRVNEVHEERNYDIYGNSLDNEKAGYVKGTKYPRGTSHERSDDMNFQRNDFPENDLLTYQSRNNDRGQRKQFKGTDSLKRNLYINTQLPFRHSRGSSPICSEYPNETSRDQSGSKSFLQNERPYNPLRNDNAKRSEHMKPTYQKTHGKLGDNKRISHQGHKQEVDTEYLDWSILATLDNIPSNLRKDERDRTPPLIRTIQNFERKALGEKQKHSDVKTGMDKAKTDATSATDASASIHDRRTQKVDNEHSNKFICFPQDEQAIIWRSDEGSTSFLRRTNQNYQGKLDDTGEKRVPRQFKDETELATSMRFPSQEESDVQTGMGKAKMDATSTTNSPISIRGNIELSGVGLQKKYFYDMWMKGKFCDVKIVVDGHSFLAHRVVLAVSSEYFDKFFSNSPARLNDTEILTVYVTDISADVFRVILMFMYTGHIDIQFGQVSQLLKGSLFLSMKSLMEALQDFLLNTWKEECIGAFCLAQTAGLHDLTKVILNYIQTHFIEVSTSENFALCPAEHASSILSDDNLSINEETDVLFAVLLWLEHHTRDISSNLRLLRHVRFEYISTVTLDRIEKSHLNSIANESMKRYIQDARKRASCLEARQLHFDPPIIRRRIAEVVGCRTSRTKNVDSIESVNTYRSSKTSIKKERISPSEEEQPSSHSQSEWSLSPSPSKSWHSEVTKAVPFPSYHEIDETPIRVSLSKDVSTSPVASKDDLEETSRQESAEDESSVQVVRIGGISRTWNEDYVHSDIEKLDNRHGKRWEEWISFAELPVAVHHHAACYIHNSIYISGGHVQLPCDASSNHFKPSRVFHVYDVLKRKWYRLADLESARVFHQMVALFGQIYVIGGQGHDGEALATVERYSPYTDSWRRVAPLSFPRYATAAAVYNFHLWVAGGATNHVTTPIAEDGQQSGDDRGASVYDGFYRSASTFLTGVVECYSPHDNSWTKIKDLPSPRCHAALLRIKKRLFLVGGFSSIRHFPADDNSTSSVDVYDDVTESWRHVTDVGEGSYSANAVIVGTKIVILGRPGPLLESDGDIISIFDTSTDKWELRRSLSLEARVGHACCAVPLSTHFKLYQT